VTGSATHDEEARQTVDYIDRLELASDADRQAFVGELIEHVEHPILASIVGAVLDEVGRLVDNRASPPPAVHILFNPGAHNFTRGKIKKSLDCAERLDRPVLITELSPNLGDGRGQAAAV
jgi:hypothetical protein